MVEKPLHDSTRALESGSRCEGDEDHEFINQSRARIYSPRSLRSVIAAPLRWFDRAEINGRKEERGNE